MKIGYVAFAGFAFLIGISAQNTEVEIEHQSAYPKATVDWSSRQQSNADYFEQFDGSADLDAVLDALGSPDLEQRFGDYRFLMYRTRRTSDDYLTTPDETSVLIFRGPELIGAQRDPGWFGDLQKAVVSTDWQDRQYRNRYAIESLRFGASKDDVLNELGEPDFIDQPYEGLEVLAYRTRELAIDSMTRRDETTSLLFEDDVYVGLSEGAPRSD